MTTSDDSTPERIVRFTVDMLKSLHEQLAQKAAQFGKKKEGTLGEVCDHSSS